MNFYRRIPLFVKVFAGSAIGAGVGAILGKDAAGLHYLSDLVLQILKLLATPLIFLSVIHSILSTDIKGRAAVRLSWIFASNAVVAVFLGFAATELLQPGANWQSTSAAAPVVPKAVDPLAELFARIPTDLVSPFTTNN